MSNILQFPEPLQYMPIKAKSRWARLHLWLITKIAGRTVVMLNVRLDQVKSERGEVLSVKDCPRAVVQNCSFPALPGGFVFEISSSNAERTGAAHEWNHFPQIMLIQQNEDGTWFRMMAPFMGAPETLWWREESPDGRLYLRVPVRRGGD